MGTGEWTLMHLLVYFHDFDFRTPYSSVLLVSLSVNTITPIHPYHLPTLNFDFLVSPITRDGKNGMHDIMSILSCQCRYILLCCFFFFIPAFPCGTLGHQNWVHCLVYYSSESVPW